MLRTPRCRLSAMKFLDRRIPRTPQAAQELIAKNRICLTQYRLVVRLGHVILEDAPPQAQADSEDLETQHETPAWVADEQQLLAHLGGDSASKEALESYFYFYYPNKETMVKNALLAGLSTMN